MKIAVYAICLNERVFAERFCASAKDADLIFVADTGSKDGTVSALRKAGAKVRDIRISPWRFDDARNAALAMLPADIDVCISLDLDEVLEPGWRAEIERLWVADTTTRMRYTFDWSQSVVFRSDKFHARHGYRWRNPVHEVITPDRITEVWAESDLLLVSHKPDPNKSRAQYLDLLAIAAKEAPHDPRSALYFARELWFRGQWSDAIAEARRYLAMPDATWAPERCYAMRTVGLCYKALGLLGDAAAWFHQAGTVYPAAREPWCELAQMAYDAADWPRCRDFTLLALAITERPLEYTVDPLAWGAWPHDLAALAAWNLGLTDLAREAGEAALALAPDDKRLADNLRFYSDAKAA